MFIECKERNIWNLKFMVITEIYEQNNKVFNLNKYCHGRVKKYTMEFFTIT